jgi:hypothetical protein
MRNRETAETAQRLCMAHQPDCGMTLLVTPGDDDAIVVPTAVDACVCVDVWGISLRLVDDKVELDDTKLENVLVSVVGNLVEVWELI